jgi:hypothetical protein
MRDSDKIIEKKKALTQYLDDMGALWSYRIELDTILSDRELIVKSLTYLELEEMDLLFDIFPYETVRDVWIKEMLPSDYNIILNKILAYIIFEVDNFDEFRKDVCGQMD